MITNVMLSILLNILVEMQHNYSIIDNFIWFLKNAIRFKKGIRFKAVMPPDEKSEQNRLFVRLLKEGKQRFRQRQFKSSLDLHLQARTMAGQMGDLIDELLIFDYLAMGKIGDALKIFCQYETRVLDMVPSIFFLQIYSKLGLKEQFLKVFYTLEMKGQFKQFPGRMIIANLCLMLLHQQKGQNRQMYQLFDKICNYIFQVQTYYARESQKIFRILHCLLRYSFKLGRYEYRRKLVERICLNLQYVEVRYPSEYQSCLELFRGNRDWDFRLVYFGW